MAHLTIEHLPQAHVGHRPSRSFANFESTSACLTEDARRIRLLKREKNGFEGRERVAIKALLSHLESGAKKRDRTSCASAEDMRDIRDRFAGHLSAYICKHVQSQSVTLIPNTWIVPASDLDLVRPAAFLQQLRSDLNRSGAGEAGGWFIASIEAEYDAVTDSFHFHAHGVAHGGMLNVIKRLRKKRKYRHDPGARQNRTGAIRPILVQDFREHPVHWATYMLQSYWVRRSHYTDSAGQVCRDPFKRRIKGKRGVDVLLWLDKNRPSDLVLLMKVKVTRKGFTAREKRTTSLS